MIIASFTVELHGPNEVPSEKGSAEQWRRRDTEAAVTFRRWIEAAPALNFPEGYRVRLVENDHS